MSDETRVVRAERWHAFIDDYEAGTMFITDDPETQPIIADGLRPLAALALVAEHNRTGAGLDVERLAQAIHVVGKTSDDPEDHYLEVNSDQLAAEIAAEYERRLVKFQLTPCSCGRGYTVNGQPCPTSRSGPNADPAPGAGGPGRSGDGRSARSGTPVGTCGPASRVARRRNDNG